MFLSCLNQLQFIILKFEIDCFNFEVRGLNLMAGKLLGTPGVL